MSKKMIMIIATISMSAWGCDAAGAQGPQGPQGGRGADGMDGRNGMDGVSAPVIAADTVIAVDSGDCGDLVAAIRGLDEFTIVGDATVTIDVSGGPYACAESLVFDHRDGTRIHLVGNSGGAPTTISFENASGVVVSEHRALGGLTGFVLSGTGTGAVGVLVKKGGFADTGPDLTVEGFQTDCFKAELDAMLEAADTMANQCHIGYLAAGVLQASRAVAANNGGDGFQATAGAQMLAKDARAERNGNHGFRAVHRSMILAIGAESVDNGGSGFSAVNNSYIDAKDSNTSGNAAADYQASLQSSVIAGGFQNPSASFSPTPGTLSSAGSFIQN